jgi:hypothetical protein
MWYALFLLCTPVFLPPSNLIKIPRPCIQQKKFSENFEIRLSFQPFKKSPSTTKLGNHQNSVKSLLNFIGLLTINKCHSSPIKLFDDGMVRPSFQHFFSASAAKFYDAFKDFNGRINE